LEAWARLSPDQQRSWLDAAQDALVAEQVFSPEGRLHRTAKHLAHEVLERWFSRRGRKVYLGLEEAVFYPDADPFIPDLFAVMDVADPGPESDRCRWVVAEEKRGIDFVLEVLVHADRRKDLVDNVTFYAALGIPEYFVYDRKRQKLYGFRLTTVPTPRYVSLEVEDGEIFSEVLGLGLAIEGRHLRFRNAGCNIPDSRDLAERATQMLKGHVERIGAMEGELESERQRADTERQRADTEQQRAETERQRAETERQRAETERQRAETERQRADAAEKALEALRARLGAEA